MEKLGVLIKRRNFLNYRIISRNSVEHIYPQNPENRNQHPAIEGEALHSFGNLVLLSVSQNSEYSNKSVNVKRSMFKEKKRYLRYIKIIYIFQKDKWSPVEIKKHREEMISKSKKITTMPSQTNEQALEAAIEKSLSGSNLEELKSDNRVLQDSPELYGSSTGYYMGLSSDFNPKYCIDEIRFCIF